ncbi:Lar family restriction alleviation protein [Ochrobactrum sp. S1502_03]|uniref:Lar family restriction alleviation protein n=1 Tax=Ochrobactrum sp. S1502_03 TaxID=3108451 RepID=UPI0037C62C2E
MANELKPCPFCHKTSYLKIEMYLDPSFEEYHGFTVVCSAAGYEGTERGCGSSGGWGETEAGAATAWNTRPAAPVDGLKTVTYRGKYIADGNGAWDHYPSADVSFDPDKYEQEALVTRSQAEAIIAAKDADNAALIHDLNRIKDHETELVNDNAALTERVKALETQLAAAKKALEFYSNLDNWKNGRFEQVEGGAVLRHHPSSAHKDRGAIARAALEGKP